jgi:hypothetical protein
MHSRIWRPELSLKAARLQRLVSSLSDLHFSPLRSWQKPRFFARGAQPAETKLIRKSAAGDFFQ